MVLVLGLDAAADAMLRRPKESALDGAPSRRAEELYGKWKGAPSGSS